MLHKDLAKHFAIVLQKQRKLRRFSQAVLAEKADCDSTMISLIERKIRNPTLNLADSLAQGLETQLSQMIKDAEDLRLNERTAKRSDWNSNSIKFYYSLPIIVRLGQFVIDRKCKFRICFILYKSVSVLTILTATLIFLKINTKQHS